MTLHLPYQGGDFYGLQTIPNDQVVLDNTVHDIDQEEDNDDEEMMAMMNEFEDGSDLVTMKSRPGSKSSWKKLKHAKSEQKRRQRMNSHHATLRTLFPNLLKKDKASVLTEVVRRVRELKKMVDDIAHEDRSGGGEGWFRSLPSEKDEASVSYCEGGSEGTHRVRMTICCDDITNMNREVMDAIRSVQGRAVRAEMSTVGGRTKVVVVVEWREGGGGGEEDVRSLRRALRARVENRGFECTRLMGHSISDGQWATMAHEILDPGSGPLNDSGNEGLAEGLILRGSV